MMMWRRSVGLRSRLRLQTRWVATRKTIKEAHQLWRTVDAVCFDVDSTVCQEEGIDVLAEFCGRRQEVEAWTTRAMNGMVKIEDALVARLQIIQPSHQMITSCLERHPPKLTKGIRELVQALHAKQVPVFLVSGGFRLMIEPVAQTLKIPLENIYANTLFFDTRGEYSGVDDSEYTSKDGGKARVLHQLKKEHGFKNIAMVGDGATDAQARPPASLFIGYGGVVARDSIKRRADWFVTDFDELTRVFKQAKNVEHQ